MTGGVIRAGVAAAAALAAVAAVAPGARVEASDLLPGFGARVPAGALVVRDAPPHAPSVKQVDGDRSDWIGSVVGLGGATLRSAGELVHEDYRFDAHGADDGLDLLLAGITAPVSGLLPDLDRPLRQGPVLAGILTAAAAPGLRPLHIGDATAPAGRAEAADLDEVRLAPADGGLHLLVTVGQLRYAEETAVLLLVDLDGAPPAGRSRDVPFGSALRTDRAELAALVTAAGVTVADLRTGGVGPPGTAAIVPDGDANLIEAFVPLPQDPVAVAVGAGYADRSGRGLVDIGPGSAPNLADLAFVREPVSVSMDEAQALVLAGGTIDAAFAPFDAGALRAGATQTAVPGPGYHEAHFTATTPGVATDDVPRQGARQSYGLYLPTTWRPGRPQPATLWLHYGGGDTHHMGAFLPNLVAQLGEDRGNVLISPGGRGTYSFFGGAGYADVFEALADSDRFGRDPDRTSIAGYSMGSYGTMLLTALHPDLWAGALAVDGTPPSYFDGWHRITPNAAPVPFVLMGFMAYGQMRPDYDALRAAGASARMYLYPTDHYTNIVLDEWTELARALGNRRRDPAPERVRYTRVPAIEAAVGAGALAPQASVRENPAVVPVEADGAFWVDGIEVRDGDPAAFGTAATVDAVTDGHGRRARRAVQELGVSVDGAVTPYVMEGVRVDTGPPGPRASTFSARLVNVGAVRFDLVGMGLCDGTEVLGTVTTDGPTTLHLDRAAGETPVAVVLGAAGTHTLTARCGPSPPGAEAGLTGSPSGSALGTAAVLLARRQPAGTAPPAGS